MFGYSQVMSGYNWEILGYSQVTSGYSWEMLVMPGSPEIVEQVLVQFQGFFEQSNS